MNIQQFQYVLAVVHSKNFETAAERCFVTQSTLSTMIGKLEAEIGIKIFNRKTKPVTVTPEGKQIIARLQIINSEIGQLKNLVQELKGEMVGELRIGIIPTIAPYLLPLFLVKFAHQFPKVEIIVKEIPTTEIVTNLKNRSLDVGILALPINDKDLSEQELFIEPFLVYDCREVDTKAKVAMDNLDFSNLWLLQEGHCLRTQVNQICELSNIAAETNLNFKFESGSMDSLLRFTKANKGITIIPYLAYLDMENSEKNHLVHFEDPVPSRSIGLLTHKFFVKKKLAIALQDIIQDAVAEVVPKQEKTAIMCPI